jgi:hypothetical protein
VGRVEFMVEVAGEQVARIVVPRGQLERCREAAIEAAASAATSEHPAFVFVVEAPWDLGPMVGDRECVYEAPAPS